MAKIRIGIMGAGYIAGVHAGVLARDERTQLTAVYDVDEHAAESLAGTYTAPPSQPRSSCSKDPMPSTSPRRTRNTFR